ncbi:hypothetical protein LDENG_00285200 [Lucifuga dentata]|nr:hypothetical protein LDENG_00285200 [Lucifuga dentata]
MASVSTERRRLFLLQLLIVSIPACIGLPGVFVSRPEASDFLRRSRRANGGLEELRRGNVERECMEEKCSYEEAKEIYPLPQQLEVFWKSYTAVDHCLSSPCKNRATCVQSSSTFVCLCPRGLTGRHCDQAIRTSFGCIYRNGGCEHFCKDFPDLSNRCYCAPGYRLDRDNSSCLPQVSVPCGRPVMQLLPRIVNGYNCPRGQCPWQALLTESGTFQCGGIILSAHWILTAAHCVWHKHAKMFHITVGKFNHSALEKGQQELRVSKVLVHPSYNPSSYDSDLALLKLHRPIKLGLFAVPICLPALDSSFSRILATIRLSTVSGWGKLSQFGPASTLLQRLEVPRVPLQECRRHSNLNVTRNMICAGLRTGGLDSCKGDSGGPLVTRYKKTWFLTGVVSWGKGCAQQNLYGIYTRVSMFLHWINQTMSTG